MSLIFEPLQQTSCALFACTRFNPRKRHLTEGVILAAYGPIVFDIKEHGYSLCDVDFPGTAPGIHVWEGTISVTHGVEYPLEFDVDYPGEVRGLTPQEWDLLRRGVFPWPKVMKLHRAIPDEWPVFWPALEPDTEGDE
jgi:hypothetical protein